MKTLRHVLILVSVLLIAGVAVSQTYQPSESNLKAREWFQDAKFGMFIHWGVYSVPADGEWVMENKKIPVAEYEKFAPQFNPVEFSAANIVALAKSAGMKYITITSKHHDGFAMWGTRQTKWNIVDATPYAKDPLKQLAEECRKQGIKLFFYHSQLDWHNPDYWPLGGTGHSAGRPEGGDFNRYLDFMDSQLTELLTQYGDVGGIWFDGMWDKPQADWRLNRTYSLIHKLQPAALIGSNHHQAPIDGEDFQMFEKDLPGANTAGFNTTKIGKLPLETCETVNGAWGYNKSDKNFKSVSVLIHYLVRAAGANANFLLNIGPMSSGQVQPEFVERLHALGDWMGKNGDTIHGTRGGPITPRSWGVSTQKGDKIYLHVLDWQDEYLALPTVAGIRGAHLFGANQQLELKKLDDGMLLRIPDEGRDSVDTIVVLDKAN
ncbi:MAG TPA: alpha-L-fucosidase [Terriglobales bacterium]|nr:alpha-L-fucosidase [Terriglobales bacterium]